MTGTRAGVAASRGISVGIDVGGTFTDMVALGSDGQVTVRKIPTTSHDQSEGVVRAIRDLGAGVAAITRVIHGTTIATNMLLERAGARVVFCATEGATDLLELRRQERASLYDLLSHHPPPLVPFDRVVAVQERLEPGVVARALTEGETRRVANTVAALSPDAVAIAFLHAYENPVHEEMLARALRDRLPDVDVILSSDVHPEIREYERTSTTVAEAYLRRGVAGYLDRLGERLETLGLPAPGVMLSSGGMRPAKAAARSAVALALSGPAGGVIGASAIARQAGIHHALSIDIGGTSADVGLIIDGAPFTENGGSIAGVPIALPRVLVETVSAGGGSIGWIDGGGMLRVGPRSAGITPGPAAFGRGGTAPTVTDAHVVLGHITGAQLSADITIDASAAERAVATLAAGLSTTPMRVAQAMIAIADAEMARALRRLSVDRGIDPRRSVLIPFGGGGPLHACGLADRMGMTRVLVPPHAGVLSALGLAISGEQRSAARSVMRSASQCDASFMRTLQDALSGQVRADGGAEGAVHRWWARSRYQGQGHELEQILEHGDSGDHAARRFIEHHSARYGFTLDRAVEIVSLRCVAELPGRALDLEAAGQGRRDAARGKAVVPLPDATMFVGEGWTAHPHDSGGWLLERDA